MKTFAQIREYAMTLYQEIIQKQKEAEKNYNKVLGMNIYSPEYLKKIKDDGEAEVSKIRRSVAADLEAVMKLTIAEKRTVLNTMLIEAPDTEQMNLLNSLQIQDRSLNSDEIKSIALQLTGNYRALHALQVIAEKAGHKFHIPVQYDYQALSDALKWAEGYLNGVIFDLKNCADYRQMSLNSKVFLNVWGNGETGEVHDDVNYKINVLDVLDANEQTTPTVEPRKLTDTERTIVESLFSNDSTPNGNTMEQIMASPELKMLVSLHPKYKALLA